MLVGKIFFHLKYLLLLLLWLETWERIEPKIFSRGQTFENNGGGANLLGIESFINFLLALGVVFSLSCCFKVRLFS